MFFFYATFPGIGYAVCEVMCTTRPCCFYQGNKNCAEEFPSWCSAMDICKKNLAMPAILATYDAKTDSNIVQKVCDGVEYLQEGHISKKNCKEICSERACCFFPGRDNCSNKYEDWCEEFAACRKLDFSENDDDYGDDTVDDQDDDDDDSSPGVTLKTKSTDTYADDEITEVNLQSTLDEICGKENVKSETGRYHCETLCTERSCCFLVGFGNCYTTNQEWCDEYKACQNLLLH